MIVFAGPKTVKKEVVTWRAANERFLLDPNKSDQKVEANHRVRDDVDLLSMFPHMHLRGQSFRYEAIYPDGKREILLDVPHYDFAWQNGYVLATPKRLPRGTVIHCTAHFDNSERNLSNPDPTKYVRWGDQTWEEMMIGYFNMTLADQDLTGRRAAVRFCIQIGEVKPSIRSITAKGGPLTRVIQRSYFTAKVCSSSRRRRAG